MSTPDYSYAFPWEREAMQGAEMPDGLSMYDQMAYISLRTLYHDYHEKRMDRATASAEAPYLRSLGQGKAYSRV